ncbi:VapC toxin family PIN domain ribonuclease [Halobacteriales archaeon QS_9_70_65]|nr:MAG: VapC toxin family PIN domain ribonuclease [Halobacteriales archaeon QS_9_70_65]
MKVLDTTFLIDYLDGVESTREYLQEHDSEAYVLPVPAYAEALLWGEVHAVDERTAVTAAEIADEMGSQGPFLSGMDALIAAVGRELDAPVVSGDGDLAHEETKQIVDVEEY